MSDILDRIRRVETTPLHGTEAWVELWEVLQDARAEIARLRLTYAERAAVDRARRAFRDMSHNDMTMQQLEDYEALCGLLERTGHGDA